MEMFSPRQKRRFSLGAVVSGRKYGGRWLATRGKGKMKRGFLGALHGNPCWCSGLECFGGSCDVATHGATMERVKVRASGLSKGCLGFGGKGERGL